MLPRYAALGLLAALPACSSPGPEAPPPGPWQTERHERLRYELLDPYDHEFRVTYDVDATTPGARTYCTPVRGDTFVSEVTATDVLTGERLDVGLVPGEEVQQRGHPLADPAGTYFMALLPRPVRPGGAVRLQFQVKYEDRDSYQFMGDEFLFTRLLAVGEVSLVLPPRHELLEVNQPVTLSRLEDGRLELAYSKPGHAPLALRVRGRRLPDEQELPRPLPFDAAPRERAPTVAQADALLREERRLELVGPAASELLWRHEFELAPGAASVVRALLAPSVRRRAVHALDTGESLASAGGDGAGELTFEVPGSAASRPRIVVESELVSADLLALGPEVCALRAERANLAEVVLPRGWTPLECNTPVALRPRQDGQLVLTLGTRTADAPFVLQAWRTPPRPDESDESESGAVRQPQQPVDPQRDPD